MVDLSSLHTMDLSSQQDIAIVRNRFLRKSWADKDRDATDQVLSYILDRHPSRMLEHAERLDNALAMGDWPRARGYLEDINGRFPNLQDHVSPREALILLRATLKLGDADTAAALAEKLSGLDSEDPRLGYIAFQAYEKAGRLDLILNMAEDLYAKAADRSDIRIKLLAYLIEVGHPGRVLALAGEDAELQQTDPGIVLQLARAHLKANPIDPHGMELLEDLSASSPDLEDVMLELSKAYLLFGRSRQALEVLEIDPDQNIEGRESYRQHVADVLVATEHFAQAGKIYRELASENPLHSGWRRAGIGALIQAGEHAKATALYEEDRMRRRLSANETFENCLRKLDSQLDQAQIPAVRFDWAYRKLQQLGAAPEDRAAWERACRRVHLADLLTIDWLETRPNDVDQVVERFQDPEAAVAPLNEALEGGQGVFIASLHMGAMFAGPAFLASQGVDFRWLGSTPAVTTMPGVEQLFSTMSMTRVGIARAVFRAIREGRAVTVAIDGGEPAVSRPVSFLGDDILMTDMVPRNVFQTGARSFYPKIIWVGDELKLEFLELIPPDPDDTVESYTGVWLRDFMECVAEMCIEAPDNLRLAGGFWTKIAL